MSNGAFQTVTKQIVWLESTQKLSLRDKQSVKGVWLILNCVSGYFIFKFVNLAGAPKFGKMLPLLNEELKLQYSL